MVLYHMWAIAFGAPEAFYFRGTHLMFAMVLVFLLYRRTEDRDDQPISDEQKRTGTRLPSPLDYALLVLGAVADPLSVLQLRIRRHPHLLHRRSDTGRHGSWAWLLIVLVLEATRRVIGWALPITAIVFLFYGLFIARLEPKRMIDQLYMTTEGIFGIPLSVSAAYVLIFVLFGSFMERTGTGQLFMDFAMSLTGHTAGGPGKVSCVSSALFGTISGSAVANVMVDGPITIPLMKRSGFPPHFAAGVEAVASTGGQIMPPIMGAAAFVMAEFLGVSYGQVVIWAIIPAVLYYVACFSAVHFEAKRRGLVGVPRSELPQARRGDARAWPSFHTGARDPGRDVLRLQRAAGGARRHARLLPGCRAAQVDAPLRHLRQHHRSLASTAPRTRSRWRSPAPAAGVVIAVVTLSGLGIVFTQYVVHLSQNYLLLALILTMIAGIVLGMGMPTTPAYIIMTALLVPAIIKFGVIAPAAHMFAFYFAILSAITPPVALAVYAAAGIAKSDLWIDRLGGGADRARPASSCRSCSSMSRRC